MRMIRFPPHWLMACILAIILVNSPTMLWSHRTNFLEGSGSMAEGVGVVAAEGVDPPGPRQESALGD